MASASSESLFYRFGKGHGIVLHFFGIPWLSLMDCMVAWNGIETYDIRSSMSTNE